VNAAPLRKRGLPALLLHVGNALTRLPKPLAALLVVLWMGMIWVLSAQEGQVVPHPEFWWSWFFNLGHAPVFGTLGLLVAGSLLPPGEPERAPLVTRGLVGAALGLVLAYGIVDELHQGFTPGRNSSVYDIGTDLVAAACVLAVIAYLGRSERSTGGLLRRLGLGVLACLVAALVATLAD